ncbi:MAG: hypothetical protein K2Q10_06565, partial [Rhodospirillales bacterium]|nr:hypothetical protein [Rhodospirillales bacterium]
MTLYVHRTVALVAKETTYKTDPGGASAVQMSNLSVKPLAGSTVDRKLVRPFMGASPKISVASHRTANFEVEAAGSGSPGTEPGFGALLRACGMTAAVTATDVTYTPVSSGFDSAAIHLHHDGQLRTMLGSR